jgi:hypothetical protein
MARPPDETEKLGRLRTRIVELVDASVLILEDTGQ